MIIIRIVYKQRISVTTCSFAGGGEGRKRYQGCLHNSLSRSIDFAKLNQNCHMNYSIIFTEISFYPETSS